MVALILNILIFIVTLGTAKSVVHEIYGGVLMCAVTLLAINFNIAKKVKEEKESK